MKNKRKLSQGQEFQICVYMLHNAMKQTYMLIGKCDFSPQVAVCSQREKV